MLKDSNVISLQISTADIIQQIVWIGSSSIRTVRTFVPEPGIPGILDVRVIVGRFLDLLSFDLYQWLGISLWSLVGELDDPSQSAHPVGCLDSFCLGESNICNPSYPIGCLDSFCLGESKICNPFYPECH